MKQPKIEIRRIEADDYRALRDICAQPKVVWGTLQMPSRARRFVGRP